MAVQYEGIDISGKAYDDMSSSGFVFVKVSGDEQFDVCSAATDIPVGVLQVEGETGNALLVRVSGHTKLEMGESVSAGDLVGTANDGQGVVITAGSSTTAYVMGRCYVGADDGEVGEIVLTPGGRAA